VTISGTATGVYGTQALIRLWKGNPAVPGQKDTSSGAEVMIGQPIQIMLTGSPAPFNITNVPLLPNAPNYFVVTVADAYGNNESLPVAVPVITQSAAAPQTTTTGIASISITSPTTPTTIYAPQSSIPVSGSVAGTYFGQVLVRIWKSSASAPTQKDFSTGAEVQVGPSIPLTLSGMPQPFTANISLVSSTTNYFVATVSDQYGNNESNPVPIPVITQSGTMPATQTYSITLTAPSTPTTVYPPQNTIAISGMVTGPVGSQAMLRVWLASAAAPYQKDMSSGSPVQVGYLPPTAMTGFPAPFSFPAIALTPNTTNYFVVTAADPYGNNETAPTPVPAISAGSTATSGSSVTVTSPSAPTTIYAPQTTIAVSGMVNGAAGTQGLVRLWLASPAAPYQKQLVNNAPVQVGYLPPILLTGIAVPYTFATVPLALNAPNYFVVTVSDQYGNGESSPVPVPVITQGATAGQGSYSATVTSPAAPLTVYPPQTTASISGTAAGPVGTQGLVRVWKASASTPNQKDLSTGTEVQVGYQAISFMSPATPFMVPTVMLAANAANYFVVTVSDQYGNGESNPVPVPVITQGTVLVQGSYSATITSPTGPITVNPPQTAAAISGTATGPAGTQGLVRVWKASAAAPNQKDLSTGTEVQVGFQLVALTSGITSFTLPNIALAQNAANYFVLTVSDQYGNGESNPVPVPVITQGTATAQGTYNGTVMLPAAPITVYPPQTTAAISGTAIGPAGTQGLVRVWKATAATPTQKDLSTGYEVQTGYPQTVALTGAPTPFNLPAVPLVTNTVNYLVVTVSDPNGNYESLPVQVPAIAQGTAALPSVTGFTATLAVTTPSAPLTLYPQTSVSIGGTVTGPAGTQALVRIWKASAANPYVKDLSSGQEVQVMGGAATITLAGYAVPFTCSNVALQANTTNYFVATVSDQYGNYETVPVPVPPISQSMYTTEILTVRKPAGPVDTDKDSYTIRGQAAPGSLVQVWLADDEGEKRSGARSLGAAQLTGNETHYAITVSLTRRRQNRFVVTATSAGIESAPVVVPTLVHQGPLEEFDEEIIIEEKIEEERLKERRGRRAKSTAEGMEG